MLMSVFYLSADDLYSVSMGDDFIVHPVLPLCFTVSYSLCTFMSINRYSPLFQYYEMSYGLNIEMHKQVSQDSLSFCTPPPPSRSFASFSCIITSSFLCPQSARKLWELFVKENLPSLLLLCQSSLWRTCRAVLCCGGVNRIHKQNSFLHHRQMRILCPSLLPIINPHLLFPPSVLSILSLSPYFSIPSSFFFIFSLQFMSYCIFLMLPALNLHFFAISVALPFDWFLFLFISLFSVHPVSTSVSF